VKRRSFCVALTLPLAFAMESEAQSSPSVRVAWVSIERQSSKSPYLEAFRDGMRELGYSEGKNLIIDKWWGDGSEEKLAKQIDSIVRSQPTVIVAQGGLALHPLTVARVKIPIVFGISADPVEAKIAESFARPGGTATGMSFFALDLVGTIRTPRVGGGSPVTFVR
jgi:putative ABC transport system substrate-binding protein